MAREWDINKHKQTVLIDFDEGYSRYKTVIEVYQYFCLYLFIFLLPSYIPSFLNCFLPSFPGISPPIHLYPQWGVSVWGSCDQKRADILYVIPWHPHHHSTSPSVSVLFRRNHLMEKLQTTKHEGNSPWTESQRHIPVCFAGVEIQIFLRTNQIVSFSGRTRSALTGLFYGLHK